MKKNVSRLSVVPKCADWIRPGVKAAIPVVKSAGLRVKSLQEIRNTNSTVKVDDKALQNLSQNIACGKVRTRTGLFARKLPSTPLKYEKYKGNCP